MTVCHTMKTKQQYKGAKYWYTPQHRQISKIITLSERKLRQYILYFIVYIKLLENVNYSDRKLISVGGGGRNFWGCQIIYYLDYNHFMVTHILSGVKLHTLHASL